MMTVLETPKRGSRSSQILARLSAAAGVSLLVVSVLLSASTSSADAQVVDAAPEMVLQRPHRWRLSALALSPDRRAMATASVDGTVKLWNADSLELKRDLSGAVAGIRELTFSPDGALLISQSSDDDGNHFACVWNGRSGDFLHRLDLGKTRVVYTLPGDLEATIGEDQILKLWNARTGEPLGGFRSPASTVSVAGSPDGKRLVVTDPLGGARLLNADTGAEIVLLRTPNPPSDTVTSAFAPVFSPDGRTLLLVASGESLEVRDGISGSLRSTISLRTKVASAKPKLPAELAKDPVGAAVGELAKGFGLFSLLSVPTADLAFAPDGKSFVTVDGVMEHSRIAAWRTSDAQELWHQDVAAKVHDPIFSPDGRVVGVSISVLPLLGDDEAKPGKGKDDDKDQVSLIDPQTGKIIQRLSGSLLGPSFDFLRDSSTVVTFLAESQSERKNIPFALWEAATGKLKRTVQLFGEPPAIVRMEPAPNGHALTLAAGDLTLLDDDPGELHTWDLGSGSLRELGAEPLGTVRSLAYSPDGKLLATGGHTGRVWLWQGGRPLRPLRGAAGPVYSLAFSPDGQLLAGGSGAPAEEEGHKVVVWRVRDGLPLHVLREHTGRIEAIRFSPDGKMLATGSADKMIKLWSVTTGKLLKTLTNVGSGPRALAFSPDGRQITAVALDTLARRRSALVKSWSLPQGRVLSVVDLGPRGKLGHDLALSRDGREVSLSTDDGVYVEDAQTARVIRHLPGPWSSVAYSADGRRLFIGDRDRELTVWNAETGKLQVRLSFLPWDEKSDGTDWVAVTPEGDYDASPGAIRSIRWRVGDQLLPATEFEARYHHPDRVREALH